MIKRKCQIDMLRLLAANGVHVTPPNSRGWIAMGCPFCGRPYLGWHVEANLFKCWYCNRHPVIETLMRLLSCSQDVACSLADRYSVKPAGGFAKPIKRTASATEVRWPIGIGNLSDWQLRYLQKRGFDPEQVAEEWDLRGIGIAGGQYANRIVIPTHLKGVVVSWQARSISAGAKMRYLSCPMDWEVVDNKQLVYGLDKAMTLGAAVVVEGPVDVWKMGAGAVHTFGTSWTISQMKALSGLPQVTILFDNERTAQRQAHNLAESLAGLGTCVEVACLSEGKDPGDLPRDEMHCLCKELLNRKEVEISQKN